MADIELNYTELFDLEEKLRENNQPYFLIERGINECSIFDNNFVSKFNGNLIVENKCTGVPRHILKEILAKMKPLEKKYRDSFLRKDRDFIKNFESKTPTFKSKFFIP